MSDTTPKRPKATNLSDVIPHTDRRRMDRVGMELHSRGLSYASIAVVVELYEGYDLNDRQVRRWLQDLGAPKDERRAAAALAQHSTSRTARC